MQSFFEPNYTVLTFFFVKKFVYLELLAVLALIRLFVGAGWSRLPALAALVIALAGLATIFAPAVQMGHGPIYVSASRMMIHGAGMTALVVPSAVFLTAMACPARRARWVDWLHVAMIVGLVGLWIATMF